MAAPPSQDEWVLVPGPPRAPMSLSLTVNGVQRHVADARRVSDKCSLQCEGAPCSKRSAAADSQGPLTFGPSVAPRPVRTMSKESTARSPGCCCCCFGSPSRRNALNDAPAEPRSGRFERRVLCRVSQCA